MAKAADTIAELKDTVNERELTIGRLLKEKGEDERTIAHLRERETTLAQEIKRMEGVIRNKNDEREAARQENLALKGEIVRIGEDRRTEVRAAECDGYVKQQNLSFRASIAQTILAHCTLNETIAKDVSLVLAGGLEGIVTRLS